MNVDKNKIKTKNSHSGASSNCNFNATAVSNGKPLDIKVTMKHKSSDIIPVSDGSHFSVPALTPEDVNNKTSNTLSCSSNGKMNVNEEKKSK